MTTTDVNPTRRKLIDYLASFGLDANEIPAEAWDENGFHLYRPGAEYDIVHPWPEGFDYKWFVQLFNVAWMEDRRLWSV